jgi:hypothetical protein
MGTIHTTTPPFTCVAETSKRRLPARAGPPVPALPDLEVRIAGGAPGCHAGCSCTFGEVQDAVRHRDGLSPDEHYAWVSYKETCAGGLTVVCDELEFIDNENADGVCGNMSNADLANLWSTDPYAPHTNYSVTLTRASYD